MKGDAFFSLCPVFWIVRICIQRISDAIHHISVCRRNLDAYLLPLILVARPELELKRSGKGILAHRYLHFFGMNTFDGEINHLSGAHNLSQSVYEAGELEGLGAFKRLVYIDLPLLVSQIKYFIIIGVINGVQVYDIQLILGLSAIDPASTVPGYMLYYYTFASPEYGYAASIGVLLFVITLAVSTVSNKISDRLNAENGV